jgi:hypothetical protein
MNILHQTQRSLEARMHDEFSTVLVQEIAQLKNFILELEKRMERAQSESLQTQQEIRQKFIEDIGALATIEANQEKFLVKFTEVEAWHEDVKNSFRYFSQEQLPKLDDVVHKHIDILRISEKDHYNKLQELLKKAVESRFGIADDIHELHLKLDKLSQLATSVSQKIVSESTAQLQNVVKDFEQEMLLLKSNTGVVSTSLHESETVLANIRSQSEMIMKQMILSSKKMDELSQKNSELGDLFQNIQLLLNDVESVKSEYVKAQAQLTLLVKEFHLDKDEDFHSLQEKFDTFTRELTQNVQESLENLQKHLELDAEKITSKANLLAKKAQIKKGYSDVNE